MARIRVTQAVVDAYRQVLGHMPGWFSLTIAPVAIIAVVGVGLFYLGTVVQGVPALIGNMVGQALSVFATAWAYLAWIRHAAGGFRTVQPVDLRRLDGAQYRFLALVVVLLAGPALLVTLSGGQGIADLPEDASDLSPETMRALLGALSISLAASAVILFLMVRLSAYLVDLALGGRPSLRPAVAATRPYGWTMFFSIVLAAIPVALASLMIGQFVFSLFGFSRAAVIVMQVAGAFVSAFACAVNSSIAVLFRAQAARVNPLRD